MLRPNFLYIGTSKAGSTWIYNLLNRHPDIYMAPGKGTYFFDGHYDKGLAWYLSHFRSAKKSQICGEVSHSYMYSPVACSRIHQLNPDMKLMICLRNPVDRAFSAYLDRVKNGRFAGTFEEAIEQIPSLVERGRYATHLEPYVATFGRNNLFVSHFDKLKSNPRSFAQDVFDFLEVRPLSLRETDLRKRMPAGQPRSIAMARAAKTAAAYAKGLGMMRLIGSIKRSLWIRNLLYRPFTPIDTPQMDQLFRRQLQAEFRDELQRLDQMLDTDFARKWLENSSTAPLVD